MKILDFIKNLFKKEKVKVIIDKDFEFPVSLINAIINVKYANHFALIPSNLDLDNHVERHPLVNYGFVEVNGKILTKNSNGNTGSLYDKNRMLHLIDLLNIIPANNKDSISEDGFVSINSKVLRGYFKDYLSYLNYLVDTDIFISNNHYIVGKQSIGYKFAPQYENTELTAINYPGFNIENIQPIQRIVYNSINENFQPNTLLDYPYLAHWYNQKLLDIDMTKATKYAYLLMRKKFNLGYEHWDVNRDKWSHERGDYCRKYPKTQYNAIIHNISSITIKDYRAKIDAKVYRLHSVITNMQKDYRNFLTYNGSQLISIDVSNSQPYLMCLLFNPSFWQANSGSLNIYHLPESIQNMFAPTHLDEIKSYVEALEDNMISDYKQKASEGIIYEHIRDMSNNQLGTNLNRDDAKVMMLIVFFSSNKFFNQTDALLKRLFAQLYPNIYGLIKLIKRNNHASFACLLQAIESEIILHKCCRRIWEENNQQVPIFTIHDSISTTLRYRELVRTVIQDELTAIIGIPPCLKDEIWREEELKHQDILAQINQIRSQ